MIRSKLLAGVLDGMRAAITLNPARAKGSSDTFILKNESPGQVLCEINFDSPIYVLTVNIFSFFKF